MANTFHIRVYSNNEVTKCGFRRGLQNCYLGLFSIKKGENIHLITKRSEKKTLIPYGLSMTMVVTVVPIGKGFWFVAEQLKMQTSLNSATSAQ